MAFSQLSLPSAIEPVKDLLVNSALRSPGRGPRPHALADDWREALEAFQRIARVFAHSTSRLRG